MNNSEDKLCPDSNSFLQKKKSIAVIGSKGIPSRVSGLEVYVQAICTALADDYDITVYCRKRYCDADIGNYKGVKVVHVSSINTKHLDAITYSLSATMSALIKGYDLYWYHALGPAITAFLPKITGKKILSTVHGLDWKREKFGRMASAALKAGEFVIAACADQIIVLNKSDQKHFANRWGRDAHIVKNGVEIPNRTNLGYLGEELNIDKEKYILFASRIVPEKNVHILINAFKMLNTDMKLIIAGSGVHTNGYEEKVHEIAQDSEDIIFTGHVQNDILKKLYSNAYCYVLPSTVEGQSMGLLEAMSYGLPCVVSNIPENMETAHSGAVYFSSNDTLELAACLQVLLDDPQLAKTIGEKAWAIVRNYHNKATMVKDTKTIIEQCMRCIPRRPSIHLFRSIKEIVCQNEIVHWTKEAK